MDVRANARIIRGYVPLSSMFGYATDLRSKTSGRATYSMQFDHYDPIPADLAEKVLKG
jgi:elongation factor G